MIPGTLRPLPKKVKEVKTAVDLLLRTVDFDVENTKDIFKDSSLYTFEEINSHYMRIIDQYTQIRPLTKDADKLVDKYVNDYLLNELVYGQFTKLEMRENRLKNDIQRLDNVLMSKRKKYIEEMIPRFKDEISSKLSFMQDLSFDEILEKGQLYGETIGKIVNKISGIRDEYNKLSSGSFDVSEFYSYLDERLTEVEEQVTAYDLILRTCKMQMLSEEAEMYIENGNVINNEFEVEASSELVLKGDEYVNNATEKLEAMMLLRVNLPKRGISKEFSTNFKNLSITFEEHKKSLLIIIESLQAKTTRLSSQIERINALKTIAESDGEEIYEVIEMLNIKRKGAFKTKVEEGFPVFELSPLGKLKMPLGVEFTTPMIEEILTVLDEIEGTTFKDDMMLRWKTMKIGEITENIGRKLAPAYNKTKEVTIKSGKKVGEFSKKAYVGTKKLFTSDKEGREAKEPRIKKEKKPKKEKVKEEKIEKTNSDEEIEIPPPPTED
ncbi:MAG: hypothetical protein ACTSSN_12415 [Candidatus Heimdallarchaeaceae archaeon]